MVGVVVVDNADAIDAVAVAVAVAAGGAGSPHHRRRGEGRAPFDSQHGSTARRQKQRRTLAIAGLVLLLFALSVLSILVALTAFENADVQPHPPFSHGDKHAAHSENLQSYHQAVDAKSSVRATSGTTPIQVVIIDEHQHALRHWQDDASMSASGHQVSVAKRQGKHGHFDRQRRRVHLIHVDAHSDMATPFLFTADRDPSRQREAHRSSQLHNDEFIVDAAYSELVHSLTWVIPSWAAPFERSLFGTTWDETANGAVLMLAAGHVRKDVETARTNSQHHLDDDYGEEHKEIHASSDGSSRYPCACMLQQQCREADSFSESLHRRSVAQNPPPLAETSIPRRSSSSSVISFHSDDDNDDDNDDDRSGCTFHSCETAIDDDLLPQACNLTTHLPLLAGSVRSPLLRVERSSPALHSSTPPSSGEQEPESIILDIDEDYFVTSDPIHELIIAGWTNASLGVVDELLGTIVVRNEAQEESLDNLLRSILQHEHARELSLADIQQLVVASQIDAVEVCFPVASFSETKVNQLLGTLDTLPRAASEDILAALEPFVVGPATLGFDLVLVQELLTMQCVRPESSRTRLQRCLNREDMAWELRQKIAQKLVGTRAGSRPSSEAASRQHRILQHQQRLLAIIFSFARIMYPENQGLLQEYRSHYRAAAGKHRWQRLRICALDTAAEGCTNNSFLELLEQSEALSQGRRRAAGEGKGSAWRPCYDRECVDMAEAQRAALASLGFGTIPHGDRDVLFEEEFPAPMSIVTGVGQVRGGSRPLYTTNTLVYFDHPTEAQLQHRVAELKAYLMQRRASLRAHARLVTLCRSVRDGYLPRKHWQFVEEVVLQMLYEVFEGSEADDPSKGDDGIFGGTDANDDTLTHARHVERAGDPRPLKIVYDSRRGW